uniref:LRAT domain-containing protein n=1 Tax=Parastrongyloides trichosuri TaxID=131310 RepID=A0A0N4Z765_PARTI
MRTLSQNDFKESLNNFLLSFNDKKYMKNEIIKPNIRKIKTEWSSLGEIKKIIKPGDLIEFDKRIFGVKIYSHYGIFLGIINNEYIIGHLSKEENNNYVNNKNMFTKVISSLICGRRRYSIQLTKIEYATFRNGRCRINNKQDKYMSPFNVIQIRKICFNSLGHYPYNSLFDNCEHFVNRMRYGIHYSSQADKAYYKGFPIIGYITIFKYIQWKRKRRVYYNYMDKES